MPAPTPSPRPLRIDRSAEERVVAGLVETLRNDPGTRVLVVRGDAVPLAGDDALLLVPAARVPEAALWAFLGRDADGAGVLVAALPADAADPFIATWSGARTVGGLLPADEVALLLTAVALARWLNDAPHCPFCGALLELRTAGWSRHCPSCGREHFPRTDPAVIVAVTHPDDPDLLLLGSNALWGGSRYSCFAGFVEAGESLEDTVAREVAEEAGVGVARIEYRASQSWPYPRSLMLGFRAVAEGADSARPDGEEILDVRWFTRAEIGAALAGGGDVQLPGPASIAHRLISDWHAGER